MKVLCLIDLQQNYFKLKKLKNAFALILYRFSLNKKQLHVRISITEKISFEKDPKSTGKVENIAQKYRSVENFRTS